MILELILTVFMFIFYVRFAYKVVDYLNDKEYKPYIKIILLLSYGFFGAYVIKLVLRGVECLQIMS